MDYLVTAKKSHINICKDMEKWPFWQIKWQKQDSELYTSGMMSFE